MGGGAQRKATLASAFAGGGNAQQVKQLLALQRTGQAGRDREHSRQGGDAAGFIVNAHGHQRRHDQPGEGGQGQVRHDAHGHKKEIGFRYIYSASIHR